MFKNRSVICFQQIGNNPQDESIIQAFIAMAKALQINLIFAEGIETDAQLEYLTKHGCNDGQGYLLGSPSPCERIRVNFGLT